MRRMINKDIPWEATTGSVYITNNQTTVRKNEIGQKELKISFTGVNGGSGVLITLPAGYAPLVDIPIEVKTVSGIVQARDLVLKTNGTISTQATVTLAPYVFRGFIVYI